MEGNEHLLAGLVGAFEVHDVGEIRKAFDLGIDPNGYYKNKRLIDVLITMYLRSPRFSDCVQLFIDYGLEVEDELLFAIFLNDRQQLLELLNENKDLLKKRYTIEGSAYIPLIDVGLLHLCAEYNLVECAKVLMEFGADVNERAGIYEPGFGGQTPVFHTVNQNLNNSIDMLHFLLDHETDLDLTVKGIEWGLGYEWETLIPSVNPTSFAMMGLLPQMHRKEKDIYTIVSLLLKHKYGIDYKHRNMPNKYLQTF